MSSHTDPTATVANTPALRQIKNLPGPRAWPLVGNVLQLKPHRIHLDVELLCQRFGPLLRLYFGRQPVVVVANHGTVNAISAAT